MEYVNNRVSQGERKRIAAAKRVGTQLMQLSGAKFFSKPACIDSTCTCNMSDDIDHSTHDIHTHIGSGGFRLDSTLDGFGNRVGSSRNCVVGSVAVEPEEASKGYNGVKGVLDVRADGGGAGSHLVGGAEVVPVGRHMDIVVVGGSVGGDVDGNICGEALFVSDNNNDRTTTTTTNANTIHIDTSIDTVHTTHTRHTSGRSKTEGIADINDDMIDYLQSGVRRFERAKPMIASLARNRSREEEGSGSPTPAAGIRAEDQSGTCHEGKSVDDVCDINIGDGLGSHDLSSAGVVDVGNGRV